MVVRVFTGCGSDSSADDAKDDANTEAPTDEPADDAADEPADDGADAAADDIAYPEKGISVICPWGAGGGTDACLRAFYIAQGVYEGRQIRYYLRAGQFFTA